jgi:hypothetical protein
MTNDTHRLEQTAEVAHKPARSINHQYVQRVIRVPKMMMRDADG